MQSLTRRHALAIATAAGLTSLISARSRAAPSDMDAALAALPLRQRAARMLMVPVSGTALTAEDDAVLRALKPGGVILVQDNFGAPDEVRALVAAIHATHPELPPLVALDQEGGLVSRIADDPAPDAPAMGALATEQIAALAGLRADTLAGYGFDVNFAPVADVAFAPESFMTGRAFAADPAIVAADVTAYLEGVAGSSVRHCVKHFPGHGRVTLDSHEALPILDVDPATWWAEDALPFRAAVAAGAPMVMLGHLVMPAWDALPASLSAAAVQVLRHDLAFDGVIVTDDLSMGALAAWTPLEIVDRAMAAGNDLLLFVKTPIDPAAIVDHLVDGIERGAIPVDRITASVARLLALQGNAR